MIDRLIAHWASDRLSPRPQGEFARSWTILLACIIGLLVGPQALITYTAGVYYTPLEQEFGWSRTQLSFAQTIVPVIFALTSPLVGLLNDRWGEARVVATSLGLMVVPIFLLSRMNGSVEIYWLLFALLALFGTGATTLTFSQVASTHFVLKRGLALGIALSGTGLAALFGPPVVAWVVATFGWRGGYLAVAAFILLASPFVVWPILRSQSARDAIKRQQVGFQGGTMGDAWRTSSFWILALAFPLIAYAATGLIIHYVPMLIDRGVPPQQAASIAGLTGIFLIAGRLLSGYIVDRVTASRFAAIIMLVAAAMLGAFAYVDSRFAWIGAIAIGLSIGAEFDLMAYMVAQYFGMARFGRVYGLIYALTVAAASVSPLAFGAIHDRTGSYFAALLLSSVLLGVAAFAFMLLPRPNSRPAPEPASQP
ncbi:MFS transporter [Novosphingobium sp. BL-52-GroH]|uniref:MFS transporter n=1 Tax=Novosphingobium sp. BL-52-GroH TaxID=3349877 RepID=UPI00384A6B3A